MIIDYICKKDNIGANMSIMLGNKESDMTAGRSARVKQLLFVNNGERIAKRVYREVEG